MLRVVENEGAEEAGDELLLLDPYLLWCLIGISLIWLLAPRQELHIMSVKFWHFSERWRSGEARHGISKDKPIYWRRIVDTLESFAAVSSKLIAVLKGTTDEERRTPFPRIYFSPLLGRGNPFFRQRDCEDRMRWHCQPATPHIHPVTLIDKRIPEQVTSAETYSLRIIHAVRVDARRASDIRTAVLKIQDYRALSLALCWLDIFGNCPVWRTKADKGALSINRELISSQHRAPLERSNCRITENDEYGEKREPTIAVVESIALVVASLVLVYEGLQNLY